MIKAKLLKRLAKSLKEFEELKDAYDQQTETFHELFQKEIIDRNGKIVNTSME